MLDLGLFSRFRKRPSVGGTRFGYAVVGLGHIADYFIDGLADSAMCAVSALVSGKAEKARKLAKKHGVQYHGTYADFEEVLGQTG